METQTPGPLCPKHNQCPGRDGHAAMESKFGLGCSQGCLEKPLLHVAPSPWDVQPPYEAVPNRLTQTDGRHSNCSQQSAPMGGRWQEMGAGGWGQTGTCPGAHMGSHRRVDCQKPSSPWSRPGIVGQRLSYAAAAPGQAGLLWAASYCCLSWMLETRCSAGKEGLPVQRVVVLGRDQPQGQCWGQQHTAPSWDHPAALAPLLQSPVEPLHTRAQRSPAWPQLGCLGCGWGPGRLQREGNQLDDPKDQDSPAQGRDPVPSCLSAPPPPHHARASRHEHPHPLTLSVLGAGRGQPTPTAQAVSPPCCACLPGAWQIRTASRGTAPSPEPHSPWHQTLHPCQPPCSSLALCDEHLGHVPGMPDCFHVHVHTHTHTCPHVTSRGLG